VASKDRRDGSFVGFGPNWESFFRDLAANQTKAWFEANRSTFQSEILEPLQKLVAALAFAFEVREVPLRGDPKTSVFRLNRDIRFSKDKSPYKTNAGAVLTRDGTKSAPGLLYLHIDPAGAFAALGFYMPEPPHLAALRDAIVADPDRWHGVERALSRETLALSWDSALTRLPRGYDEETAGSVADVLRLKSFVVRRELPLPLLRGAGLVDEVVAFAEAGRPLLDFGWSALAKAPRIP